MRHSKGDIWTYYKEGAFVVIPTNIGWTRFGLNPMGAGLAREAADICPDLPDWYGRRCRQYGSETAVAYHKESKLILCPTKPLNPQTPWLSWQSKSCVELIQRSLKQLAVLATYLDSKKLLFGLIATPLLGCGNGELRQRDVLLLMEQYLGDQFVLCDRNYNG